jgi:ABC-type sugar transport system ATPase subunit
MEIRLQRVGKRYGDVDVVVDLDLVLSSGRIVALLGPSGCGKTTTLRMIAGLERPTSGRIEIGGVIVDDGRCFVPPERRGLGMVFQSYALWPHKSVLDNVAYPLRVQGCSHDDARARAMVALERVRLSHLAERLPSQLSGGQQQRVAVARAIVGDGQRSPAVLLLDEPLANLDAALREQMRGELAELARNSAATVVIVTHDQQEAFAIADDVVVLERGRLAQQGSPQEIYARPTTPFVGAFGGPMAFLDGMRVGDDVVIQGVAFSSREWVAAPGCPTSGPVSVGVRPEWLGLGAGVAVEITRRLFLGREYEIEVAAPQGRRLVLRLPSLQPTLAAVGETVSIGIRRAVLFAPSG